MKKLNLLVALLMSLISLQAVAQIRIVLSAALTEASYELRKQQYIDSLLIFKKMGYENVYVIEAIKRHGPSFLDDYTTNVYYSLANDATYKNIGTNEARTLLDGLNQFNFDPDDMIIKFTGRYQLLSDSFIKLVQNNPDYDAFVHFHPNGNIYTLAFAMKCKHVCEMYASMDLVKMEREWICVETEAANYIRRKQKEGNFKVLHVEKFDIKADMNGSPNGACMGGGVLFF